MATKFNQSLIVYKESELKNICDQIALQLPSQAIIGLKGDMGAGKTTFVRYLSSALGSPDWVNSPTYSIIQQYLAKEHTIIHIDLYRCNSDQEIDQLDILSSYKDKTILIIEWFDKTQLFSPDLTLAFGIENDQRSITFSSDKFNWISALNNTDAQ